MDAFGTGATDSDTRHRLGVMQLKGRYLDWYVAQHASGIDFTKYEDITLKMFGTRASRSFKTKVAEVKGMLCCLDSLSGNVCMQLTRPDLWCGACDALVQIVRLMDGAPYKMPPDVREDRSHPVYRVVESRLLECVEKDSTM